MVVAWHFVYVYAGCDQYGRKFNGEESLNSKLKFYWYTFHKKCDNSKAQRFFVNIIANLRSSLYPRHILN